MIRMIYALSKVINNDPRVNNKLTVVFMENYCVSLAELMIPAAEISEQISLAGTEASGTSNMKFMINSAVTLGTLDGANVEIHESVGDDNIFLFGMTTSEVNTLKQNGYHPYEYVNNNPVIRRAMEELRGGFAGVDFKDIYNSLSKSDPYMVLADFQSYSQIQQKAANVYRDQKRWNRMGLINTAMSGRFAADRAIREYAENIWHASPVPDNVEVKPVKKAAAHVSLIEPQR